MKTILVPTDFSEQANNALAFASQIAKKSGATVKVIHVVEGPGSGSFNTMGQVIVEGGENQHFIAELLKKGKRDLEEQLNDDKFAGVSIESEIQVGNPYKSIAKEISENESDLVVMGTRGASGLEEVLIGSNTEKVVRHAKCPVITIKDAVDFDSIQNIVLATNLTEDQTELVGEIKKIQELTGSTLHLLKINTPNHFHTQRQMNEEFSRYVEKYGIENYTANIYNDASEEDGIIYFAEDIHACLIAMGTHGRTGLLHLLTGSIAEDLVNHSRIPVWTFSMKKR